MKATDGQTFGEVVEAFYDVTVSDGEWTPLFNALCRHWSLNESSSEEERRQSVAMLERHFERNLELVDRLPVSDRRWRSLVDELPFPALMLNRTAVVVDANAEARSALGLTDEHPIRFSDQERSAIQSAIQTLRTQDSRLLMPVSLDEADKPGISVFIRTYQPDHYHRAQDHHDLLFLAIVVSSRIPDRHKALLRQTYDLTEAEARLCGALAGGLSLDETALLFNVKKTTVRTQLARTFDKIGVNSQGELVARVLQTIFASTQLGAKAREHDQGEHERPYVDPEIHGNPLFQKLRLQDGRWLGYFEYGDPTGLPAVYLHGIIDCGLFRREDAAKTVGHGIQFVAPERPGVGESDLPHDVHPDSYANDLLELTEKIGFDRFVLVARSMGSWDAMAFAAKYPEKLIGIVLVSGRLPVRQVEFHDQAGTMYLAWFKTVWESPTLGRLLFHAHAQFVRRFGAGKFADSPDLASNERALNEDKNFLAHLRASWLRAGHGGVSHLVDLLTLYRKPLPEPPWEGLPLPVVLVHGDQDKASKIEVLESATESFRNRRVEMVEGVGHRLVHLQLDRVLVAVAQLWERTEKG